MRGSRNFRRGGGGGGGGGGGPGQSDKKALTSPQLFYSRKWLISKKTIIFQGS